MVEQYSAVGSEPVAIDSKRLQDMGDSARLEQRSLAKKNRLFMTQNV